MNLAAQQLGEPVDNLQLQNGVITSGSEGFARVSGQEFP